MNNVHIKLSVILCGWLLTTNVNLSMAQEKETPLEAFSPLIEGTWVLDNTQQTFEWGGGGGPAIGCFQKLCSGKRNSKT